MLLTPFKSQRKEDKMARRSGFKDSQYEPGSNDEELLPGNEPDSEDESENDSDPNQPFAEDEDARGRDTDSGSEEEDGTPRGV